MASKKVPDREVKGLYTRKGKRGDTWNYARFKGGRLERHSLGSCTTHSVTAARRWATNLNLQAEGQPTDYTLREVVDKVTEKARRKGLRDPESVDYRLTLNTPDWLDKSLGAITKAMVNDKHDYIARTSGAASAGQWVTILRIDYNFADKNLGWEGRNPAKGVETAPGKARQVVWTSEQLDSFLAAARAYNESFYWHDYFLIVARTGMRRGNVCAMEWKEISGEVWTIFANKFKTGVEHKVHLVPEVMEALARRKNDSPYVFPSIYGQGPLVDPYSTFQRICKAAGISGVTIHDLRRTLGSRLAAKVPLPVVAKVLGHKTINTTMKSYAVIADDVAKAALMSL